jgi:photosystem II stability/assembly factor-like uncharacterized protein
MRMRRLLLLLVLVTTPLSAQQTNKPIAQEPKPPVRQPAKVSEPQSKPPESRKPSQLPNLAEPVLKGITARSIGPAVMGGRISDIALDPSSPWTFYAATAHGGLLKTTDNGASFSAVMDDQKVVSFGAVAVAPSNSKVVWVGTGEPNDRNSSGWGNGVYRSTDGGATWSHLGLRDSKAIARIVVHPKDPDTAYVAAIGNVWSDSRERGLYKTTDGGKSWKAVLQAPAPDIEKVGCGDVAIDPLNPDTIYAVLYARRRTPWSFTSGPALTGGRDVGGIYRSSDGGASWKKLSAGLPSATGRIGLSVFAKSPKIVYAIVESSDGGTSSIDDVTSRRGGVFRTVDGGDSWQRQSALNPRPFYFSQIRVDPEDDQKVYVLGFILHASEDGGKTWREDRTKKVHPDWHALAIDARNPSRLVAGTDGGIYQSYDRGDKWVHASTAPLGEFYRINVDASEPYRICGGLQDNVNWVGPSETRSKDGIVNSDWIHIQGGDGFYCVFDPDDPNVVYAESQQGFAYRFNLASGALKGIRPEAPEGSTGFRFHWSSPLVQSRHDKDKMYLAGNQVFALTNNGEAWKPISGDLSATSKQSPDKMLAVGSGAENYGVVYTLAESPTTPGLLWTGTDDGKVWVTDNEGESWTDLSGNLPGPAKGQWMANIEPSSHDANVAYLAVSAYRSGTYTPLVFRTQDRGKSWQSIASNLPAEWPARVVREDPFNPNLLFVGTEIGLFASFNRGASWVPFGNLPPVPVDDIAIHRRDRDLIIATHGRSLYIVDDIRPFEELSADVQAAPAHLFPIAPAVGYEPLPGWEGWAGGTGIFRGANPPVGALLNIWIKDYSGDKVSIAIATASGRPVANLSAPGVPGLTRLVWDLKPTKDVLGEYGSEGSKFVKPGEYDVTLTYGKTKLTQKVKVTIAEGLETR